MVARSFKSREFRPKQNNKMYLAPPIIYIYIYMGPVNVCLKEHIKSSIFGNIFSGIEKAVNTFSISEKFFSKNDELLCTLTLRAHIIVYPKLREFDWVISSLSWLVLWSDTILFCIFLFYWINFWFIKKINKKDGRFCG